MYVLCVCIASICCLFCVEGEEVEAEKRELKEWKAAQVEAEEPKKKPRREEEDEEAVIAVKPKKKGSLHVLFVCMCCVNVLYMLSVCVACICCVYVLSAHVVLSVYVGCIC